MASMDPGDRIDLEYELITECDFSGGLTSVQTSYENPCGSETNSAVSNFTSGYNEPTITISKSRDDTPIDCNENITWTIEVTNTSGYTLPVIWVEDEMDDAFTYVSKDGDDTYSSDDGTNDGQKVYWEIEDLPNNTTATMSLTALTDQTPCSSNLDNIARAWWGCGNADGNSATNPETDEGLCLYSTEVSDTRTETREPTVGAVDISVTDNINSCDDDETITIVLQNSGRTDAQDIDLVITLPDNLTYNTGTAEGILGTDDSGTPVGIADPDVAGNVLTFYDINDTGDDLIDVLQADGGDDTYVLEFSVGSSCYVTDDIEIDIYYYDCCGDNQYSTTETQEIEANDPELSVTKTPVTTAVDCGDDVTWIISVSNNGDGNAQVVRVEDTFGDWLDYVANSFSTTVSGLDSDDFVVISGSTYGWEFNDLAANTTETFSIQATLNPDGSPQSDCSAALRQNSVRAIWGCGTTGDAIDNDPTTTGYNCENDSWSNTATSTVQMPDLQVVSITPGISCDAGDGDFNGSMTVRVRNDGDAATSSGFSVTVSDGTWTGTGTTGTLNAGQARNVTINTSGWDLDCNSCAAYNLEAGVDSDDDICECDETNNTDTDTFTPDLPDLKINSITPSCTDDGLLRMRVNIENDGCGNTTSAFIIRLEDDQGNSDQISQTSLNQGANVNIDFDNWPIECEDATVNFSATVDHTDTNCECADDNTASYNYTNNLPDLEVTGITPSVSCDSDGNFTGEIEIEITNNGNGNVTNNFNINVNDNEGWDSDIMFVAAGGTLPLETGSGSSQTVTITWNGSFTTVCDFNNISVTLDDGDAVCECSDASNTDTDSYSLDIPNLEVTDISPSCSGGEHTVEVTVENTGCGATSNVLVRLSDNDGNSQDQTITTLAEGNDETLTFSNWPVDGDPATLELTATVDPSSAICELDGSDNSDNESYDTPNLVLSSITPICNSDASYQIDLVVRNEGSADITTDFVIQLSDNDGNTINDEFTDLGGTLNINSGTQQTITFDNWPVDCDPNVVNFTGELDINSVICESNSSDNSNTGTLYVNDLEIVSVTPSVSCGTGDGDIVGSIEVTITNSGGNDINSDFQISVNDNEGWSDQLLYNSDLGGSLPLVQGSEETVTINWDRNFTSTPYVCNFNNIAVEIDSEGDICECTSSNNTSNINYDVPLPYVKITSVEPSCIGDGNFTIDVEVTNEGCGEVTDMTVRLSDNDGETQEQTVTLAANETETLTFSPWPADGDPATLEFTAEIDPLDEICELSDVDHINDEEYINPNIRLVSVRSEKISEGLYNVYIVVENNGNCCINNNFKIQVSDNYGNTISEYFTDLGGELPLEQGTSQTLVYQNWQVSGDPLEVIFETIVDPDGEVCENNPNDNLITYNTIPTLTEWAVIIFIGLLAGIGGWFIWRRMG